MTNIDVDMLNTRKNFEQVNISDFGQKVVEKWNNAFLLFNKKQYTEALDIFEYLTNEYGLSPYEIFGLYFEYGLGDVNQSFFKARKYYNLAIQGENPKAVLYLSLLHHNGKGVKKSPKKAFEILKKYSTQFNDSNIWFFLGLYYEDGIGTEKNITKAIECYKKSQNVYSYFRLNYIYCITLNEDNFKYSNYFKAIPYKFKHWFYKKTITTKNPHDDRLRQTI